VKIKKSATFARRLRSHPVQFRPYLRGGAYGNEPRTRARHGFDGLFNIIFPLVKHFVSNVFFLVRRRWRESDPRGLQRQNRTRILSGENQSETVIL